MRTAFILGLFFTISATSALAQQHAPTVAQCQADVALWGATNMETEYNKAETAHTNVGTPNPTNLDKLPLDEIASRQVEMGDCARVDEGNYQQYYDANTFYYGIFASRVISFVKRHGLWDQMKAEDTKGIR
jgi:hypothetical protein